jgi:hypothetical protein
MEQIGSLMGRLNHGLSQFAAAFGRSKSAGQPGGKSAMPIARDVDDDFGDGRIVATKGVMLLGAALTPVVGDLCLRNSALGTVRARL